jgi:hypothetical protein
MKKTRLLISNVMCIFVLSAFGLICSQNAYAQNYQFPQQKQQQAPPSSSVIIITTIPSIANASVLVDGNTHYSDSKGKIIITMRPGQHNIAVPARFSIENQNHTGNNFYTFGKWRPFLQQNFTLSVIGGEDVHLQLGIIRMSDVRLHFFDSNSNPIDKSKIEKVVLISNLGKIVELYYPFQTFLDNNNFEASKPLKVERANGNLTILSSQPMKIKNIQYRIADVEINGLDVTNRKNQQPFNPSNTTSVDIICRVYPLQIRVTDSIFGNPLDTKVDLINIDTNEKSSSFAVHDVRADSSIEKSVDISAFSSDGTIFLPQVAKGIYLIKASRDVGIAGSSAVVLTKPQNVEIKVLSYRSAAILLIVALVIIALIIIISKIVIRKLLPFRRNAEDMATST